MSSEQEQKRLATALVVERVVSYAFDNGEWRFVKSTLAQQPASTSPSSSSTAPPHTIVVPGGGWGTQELRAYNFTMSVSRADHQQNQQMVAAAQADPNLNVPPPAGAVSYRLLALYEGNFDEQGRRHGWGTMRVFRHNQRLTSMTCTSLACRWNADLPQIEWDPCRLVVELIKQQRQVTDIPLPRESTSSGASAAGSGSGNDRRSAAGGSSTAGSDDDSDAPRSEQPGCTIYTDSLRRLASVYNGLMLAMTQDSSNDRFRGLRWALTTQFLPHTLGEKHDCLQQGGVKYCGQWLVGERHGFGMERHISTGGLIYAGPYDSGQRHGVGLLFHHQSKTCLDATWSHGRVVDCPGALHVQGFPISVLGRWSGDASVSQGRLCRANGASGVWETLFSDFDEQMPNLQMEVEQMMLSRSTTPAESTTNFAFNSNNNAGAGGGVSAAMAPSMANFSTQQYLSTSGQSLTTTTTAPSAPPSTVAAAADDDHTSSDAGSAATVPPPMTPPLTSASIYDSFDPFQRISVFITELRTRIGAAREEVNGVCEPIACVLATPHMRSLLCVFQRCFLFSYGTCSPSGDDIGGGIMTAVDMAAATPPSLPSEEEAQMLAAISQQGETEGDQQQQQDATAAGGGASSSSSPSGGGRRTRGSPLVALSATPQQQQQDQQQKKASSPLDESDDVFLAPKSCMSWCALAVRDICHRDVIPQFAALSQQSHLLCIHRTRHSRDSELELFQRAIEDVVALVISVRLRLMNLANTAIIGSGGSGVSTFPSGTGASTILLSPSLSPSSPPLPGSTPPPSSSAAANQRNNSNDASAVDKQEQEQEKALFSIAFNDPAVVPMYLSGTPITGSARAAVCAWDAVLDVALPPLLRHAANICKIENSKFVLAARRMMVHFKCVANPTASFARDLFKMLLPAQLVQLSIDDEENTKKANVPESNNNNNNNNNSNQNQNASAAGDSSPSPSPSPNGQRHVDPNNNNNTSAASSPPPQTIAECIEVYCDRLIVASRTLSNMLTDGQLSGTHVTCASESTQSGLLFGCFRRGVNEDETAGKRFRANKSSRLRRVGLEGAVSGVVGAITSCCVQVREAAQNFASSVNDCLAAIEAATASASMSSSSTSAATAVLVAAGVDINAALQWGFRFVVCFTALNAESPRAILPQLLLVDTISEAEATESPLADLREELCCALLGMWKGDLPSRAPVPLATGAVFPVTLLGQWAVRSLRGAVNDITTLANNPVPVSTWREAQELQRERAGTEAAGGGAVAAALYSAATASTTSRKWCSAVFACDIKAQLEDMLRDVATSPENTVVMTARGESSGSPSPRSARTPRAPPGFALPSRAAAAPAGEAAAAASAENEEAPAPPVIDPIRVEPLCAYWLASYRGTFRRPLMPETPNTETVEAFFPQHATGPGAAGGGASSGAGVSNSLAGSLGGNFAGAGGGPGGAGDGGIGAIGRGGVGAGEVLRETVSDPGLAAILDRGMTLVKAVSKNVAVMRYPWGGGEGATPLVAPFMAGSPAGTGSAAGGGAAAMSARGDRAQSFFSPQSTTTSMVTVPIHNEVHEAELLRRVARVAAVMRVLSLRTDFAVKSESEEMVASDSDSSSSDDGKKSKSSSSSSSDDVFAGSGGAAASASTSTAAAGGRARAATTFGVTRRARAENDRKLVVRFYTAAYFEEHHHHHHHHHRRGGGGGAGGAGVVSPSSQADLPSPAEAVDEDSLESVLEWWSGRRAMFKAPARGR